jgi:hypothetical protein
MLQYINTQKNRLPRKKEEKKEKEEEKPAKVYE